MATDLVGNVKLQRFIELLAMLNHQTVDAIKSGRTPVLEKMNATIEELTADLEIELRDLRYELHSMTHSEPDDPYSRAHDRWAERQKLVERHLGDVEAEIAEMKEAIRNGTYEAE